MDAQKLGIKTAALVDGTIATAVQAARNTRSDISTFCRAFRAELSARRAARRVAQVNQIDNAVTPL